MGPIRTVGNKHDTGVQPPSAATAGKDELDTSDVTGSDLNSSETNNSFSVDSPPHKKVKLDYTPMDSSTAGFSPPIGLEPVGGRPGPQIIAFVEEKGNEDRQKMAEGHSSAGTSSQGSFVTASETNSDPPVILNKTAETKTIQPTPNFGGL